ncbi:SIMPL domain-containing protein [Longimicrobium sp.]|uniref:SIMPL domain-containing protein n=1 Tax=Longimicrobium sp. TaxID=2029185 RepID=UPI002C5863B9|nr:SIMPL domain-containing protein [Longimicrobium sp.]HSU12523.1 SIMPL domain-containing protein [Longimicrobium sp.]
MNGFLSAAILAACVLAAPAAAQDRPEPIAADARRTISVTGEAEIRVPPDEVVLTLGVETFAASLQAARNDNDARVAAVIRAARARGVPEQRVKTDYFVAEPRYDDRTHGELRVAGFVVRKSIVITLRDMAAFEPLLTDALGAGATHIHGIDFRVTRLRAYRDSARALAADAAREKAQALGERLGMRLGDPLTIGEGSNGWYSGYGQGWGQRGGAMGMNVVQNVSGSGESASVEGPTTPGQIAVRASVSVVFELTPRPERTGAGR